MWWVAKEMSLIWSSMHCNFLVSFHTSSHKRNVSVTCKWTKLDNAFWTSTFFWITFALSHTTTHCGLFHHRKHAHTHTIHTHKTRQLYYHVFSLNIYFWKYQRFFRLIRIQNCLLSKECSSCKVFISQSVHSTKYSKSKLAIFFYLSTPRLF